MNKSKIKLIFVIIVVFITLGLGVYCVSAYQSFHEAKANAEAKKEELVHAKAEIADIEKSIKQFEAEKEEFAQYLFKEQDIPAFIDGISQYAEEASIDITNMKTMRFQAVNRPATRSANIQKKNRRRSNQEETMSVEKMLTLAAMPIQVSVKGTYQSFVDFLDRMEDFKQLLTISSVEIASGRDYPELKCDFTLKIYSFKTLDELARQ